jgi:Ca2+-binding RTX toxin-like protein
MANIVGTDNTDILQGTNITPESSGDDTITALGGDDLILATTGFDRIDGGEGNDTIDFAGVDKDVFLSSTGDSVVNFTSGGSVILSSVVSSGLTSVETIIGNPNRRNIIKDLSRLSLSGGSMDVDLAANRLTYYSASNPNTPVRTVTVKNFDNIEGNAGNNRFAGNDRDNSILGGNFAFGNTNFIIGSKGNDTLYGGAANNDTLDYSNLGQTVQLLVSSPKTTIFNRANFATVDKGTFGLDSIESFEHIIGATNQDNTIDASAINTTYGVDINLATNSLTTTRVFTSPFSTTIDVSNTEVVNFVNAIGTKNNDTIVGGNKNSKLTGGGGNDTITGGTKNDRITGTDSNARGVGEVDTLTGGGGRDKFILGDRNGAYYLGNASNDYATITDFSIFNDSIDLGSLRNYSFAIESTGTIDLFAGKDVNTRDLIAKIQIADFGLNSLTKGTSSNEKSLSMASTIGSGNATGLDSIVSKINILSSVNAATDDVM